VGGVGWGGTQRGRGGGGLASGCWFGGCIELVVEGVSGFRGGWSPQVGGGLCGGDGGVFVCSRLFSYGDGGAGGLRVVLSWEYTRGGAGASLGLS